MLLLHGTELYSKEGKHLDEVVDEFSRLPLKNLFRLETGNNPGTPPAFINGRIDFLLEKQTRLFRRKIREIKTMSMGGKEREEQSM